MNTPTGPDKPFGNAPTPDSPEKPARLALEQLATAIEHLDTRTQVLHTQLEDLLRPRDPRGEACETEQKEQKDQNPTSTSQITNGIYHLTVDTNTIITRIEDILARLEI